MGWLNKLKSIAKSVAPCKYVKIKRVKIDRLKLERKHADLNIAIKAKKNKHGWVVGDCDAMLYQGLYGAVTRELATVFNAQANVEGRFNRRPGVECYKSKESKSSWSRDMAVGFIWWCYRAKNKKALNSHFRYGQENGFKMGSGAVSRIYYTPQLIGLLDQVRFKINGKKHPEWKKKLNPYVFPSGLKGYEAHIQVLIISLIGEMYGKIPNEAFKRLKEHHYRKPSNPLFACVFARFKGGNIDFALNACLNPKIDDYAPHNTMKKIDTLFAIDYLLKGI